MTRAEEFMRTVWEKRNNGADTEQKLVGAIIALVAESVNSYHAENVGTVLDKVDLLQLSKEVSNLQNDET
jgi:flagellar biosynthesis/type III secretory pathway M-ring protein FliF/YscJ